jgi:2-phospho-L-lactate guanylyltransferase
MTAMRVRAVVPMKPLIQCKLRLAPVLAAAQRGGLALAMLERVLRAVQSGDAADGVTVLGGDEAIRALCRRLGAGWEADPAGDLNGALQSYYAGIRAHGLDGILYLAGDLPRVSAEDVRRLVAELETADLVLGAGARGGTNAIGLRGGLPFRFDLGGRSLERQRAQAQVRALRWQVVTAPALQADVDTPADLERLRRTDPLFWRSVAGPAEPARSGAS